MRVGLWGDLSEDEERWDHKERRERGLRREGKLAKNALKNTRAHDGQRDVDELIPEEDRDQQLMRLLAERDDAS